MEVVIKDGEALSFQKVNIKDGVYFTVWDGHDLSIFQYENGIPTLINTLNSANEVGEVGCGCVVVDNGLVYNSQMIKYIK